MKKLIDLPGFGLWLLASAAAALALPLLAVGSIGFLARTLPRATVDWGNLLVGGIAVILFTAGVHWIGRGWSRRPLAEGEFSDHEWRLSWSVGAVAGVAALFAAAVCMVGSIHQVGWLLNDPEPLYGSAVLNGHGSSTGTLDWLGHEMHGYEEARGRLPPGGTFAPDGAMLHSWETSMLPYMGIDTSMIDRNRAWNHPDNQKYFQCVLHDFVNPDFRTVQLVDHEGYGLSHYAANSHVMGSNREMRLQDITDGTSTTLLIGEVNVGFKPWGHPANFRDPVRGINTTPRGFGGPKGSGGAQFLMVDGSVRFVSDRISPEVLKALSTPAGGEIVDERVLERAR
jgi:prepilin-type processing-associated H-X9-DG protein